MDSQDTRATRAGRIAHRYPRRQSSNRSHLYFYITLLISSWLKGEGEAVAESGSVVVHD